MTLNCGVNLCVKHNVRLGEFGISFGKVKHAEFFLDFINMSFVLVVDVLKESFGVLRLRYYSADCATVKINSHAEC